MFKFKYIGSFLYRWRYWIGYGLVAAGLITALLFAGLFLPGGISNQEVQSVVKSGNINFHNIWTIDVVNLPYYFLQHASLALLGVSILSIKLPSIILAFLSVVGLILLLKTWYKPSIGILASLIAITTGQFLFIAQNGTPDILYLFWSVWLILIASLIPTHQKYRKLLIAAFFGIATLSLYTPLSIYVLIVIVSAIILHPHLRYLIKQLSLIEMMIGSVVALIFISPLIAAVIRAPKLLLTMLGWPTVWPNLSANINSLGAQYLGFANPTGSTIITPFFELGSILLILIGAYFVFHYRVTAKSYVVALWTLCLIPVLILNPSFTSITFLPLVLLLASGLSGLLSHWYELFPRNPYARIGGLVPIVILVSVLVLSGVNRYINGYRYDPDIVPNFSKDLQLIPADTKNILVANSELPFYKIVTEYNKKLNVSITPYNGTFLASRAAKKSLGSGYTVSRIITSSTTNESDRFYLYKK